MKLNIILSMFAIAATLGVGAQEKNSDEAAGTIKVGSDKVKFTVGGRLAADGAYVQGDYTPTNSGVAITDARINTSLSVGDNWYLRADFGFADGNFSQKDIYLRYNWGKNKQHWVKAGYYAEPLSMNQNTSRYEMQFITRPTSSSILTEGRNLGITYRFANDMFFANQGVFVGNKYNDQDAGGQGINASGRWLYKPINNSESTLHVGFGFGYQKIQSGEYSDGVLETYYSQHSSLETYISQDYNYLSFNIPWASDIYTYSIEALYMQKKFFVRGEYQFQTIEKNDRDDQRLFENQLGGGLFASSTLEAWQSMNEIRSNNFSGGYLEAGYLILGDKYSYNNSTSVLSGVKGKNSLQLLLRYGYTDLNDINDGDVYSYAMGRFYENGELSFLAGETTSLAGGAMHSFTVGLNYGINNYIKVLVDYTYNKVDNVKFPMDTNFNIVQARLTMSF